MSEPKTLLGLPIEYIENLGVPKVGYLELMPELFAEICKIQKDGPPGFLKVITNPLPDDAEVVGIERADNGNLRMAIKSRSYNDGQVINPPLLCRVFQGDQPKSH
jgi:hypothetical protein